MRRIRGHTRRRKRTHINPGLLQYPKRQSEFEIQAYLFSELKSLGLDVRGEVRAGRESRFDLVVFEERAATQIIEVKTRRLPRNPASPRLREMTLRRAEQMARYRAYDVSVELIEGMRQAELFVQKVREEMRQEERSNGVKETLGEDQQILPEDRRREVGEPEVGREG